MRVQLQHIINIITSTDNQAPSETVIKTVNNNMKSHENALLQVTTVTISKNYRTVTVNAFLEKIQQSLIKK